jgi:cAMP phosphodiesterase
MILVTVDSQQQTTHIKQHAPAAGNPVSGLPGVVASIRSHPRSGAGVSHVLLRQLI